MSTDTTTHQLRRYASEEGRFQRRVEPPDPLRGPPNVNYPARDGRLMSDNTLQERWIDKIKGGLDYLFRDNPKVFIASDLMWYPVKGNNRRRLAPDVMVAFGRPKKDRQSYIQHRERGVAPQVVFEILSPGNRKRVMDFKRARYEAWGVEEYYVFDPYEIGLEVWLSEGDAFQLKEASGWVSPRLGIRFELGEDMTIFAPDGRPFLDYVEVARERDEAERVVAQEQQRAEAQERLAQAERERAGRAEQQAEAERQRAEAERQRAEAQERLTEAERGRAERLAARLRELGFEPDE
jgi:Uma2 family endonuclease